LKEHIKTINGFTESKFKEKGSLFIGQAFPVKNEDEIISILNQLRKDFYDSTHICYAYRLASDKQKYSDDGEPSGTAGIRIMNAIEHFELSDILVVSIRYFGGTKLGVGPLGKAYYKSTIDTISSSSFSDKYAFKKIKIFFDIAHVKTVYKLLTGAKVLKSDYEGGFYVEALVLLSKLESTLNEIQSNLNNKCTIKLFEEVEYLEIN